MKENDLPSLFGAYRGAALEERRARARRIRPALSGNQFLPLAVPNNVITKVQVRYYDECGPDHTARRPRRPRAAPGRRSGRFAAAGGGTLWGLPSVGPPVGDRRPVSFALTVPSYGGCGQPYLPVGVEVRLASPDEVDLTSRAPHSSREIRRLLHRLSQFRVWNDGNADTQPRIANVTLTVDAAVTPTRTSARSRSARPTAASAPSRVNWGTVDDPEQRRRNFTVSANGVTLTPVTWNTGGARPVRAGRRDSSRTPARTT